MPTEKKNVKKMRLPQASLKRKEDIDWENNQWAKRKLEQSITTDSAKKQELIKTLEASGSIPNYEKVYADKPKYTGITPKSGLVRNDGVVEYSNSRVYDPRGNKKGSLVKPENPYEEEKIKWDSQKQTYAEGTSGVRMKPKASAAKPATPTVTRNTQKATVLTNLVDDPAGRSSSNDANVPRPEQQLMNESLQVPHPFEKGKSLGWGEFKTLAKTHASKFRDMGITDVPAYQQKAYDTALGSLEKFPEQAVTNYQNTRVAERTKVAIAGVEKKPTGRVVAGGQATYAKGTKGIRMKKKGC